MRDYAKLTEAEKPLIVSAMLLALQHRPSEPVGQKAMMMLYQAN